MISSNELGAAVGNPYLERDQQLFRSLFTQEGLRLIEALLKNPETRKRHPVVELLYSNDERFVHQHLINILHSWSKIHTVDPEWLGDARNQERLLSEETDTSSAFLGELKAYGYLLEVFAGTKSVPVAKSKTPDFKIVEESDIGEKMPVFVEVHSMAWTKQMTEKMDEFERDFADGKIGTVRSLGKGTVRSAAILSTPFSGEKRDSATEDAISKIAAIGKKANQFPLNSPGILWLNFEQHIWSLELTTDDCCPIFSRAGGDIFSGKIWHAVYGKTGARLYEPFPGERDLQMEHNGMFQNNPAISAVIVSLSNKTVLLENADAVTPLPDWFRRKAANIRWFKAQFSKLLLPGFDLKSHIESERMFSQSIDKLNDDTLPGGSPMSNI